MLLTALGLAARPAHADYNFSTISNPSTGYGTYVTGINNTGQIVGTYIDASYVSHGFLSTSGGFTAIKDPDGSINTAPAGINASGQIVGYYYDAHYKAHGFLLSAGRITTIDGPDPAYGTYVTGINDAGQVVGYCQNLRGEAFGFLDSAGTFTPINDPDAATGAYAAGTYATGINNSGQIVGYYSSMDGHTHGFLKTATDFKTVIAPQGSDGTTHVYGINDAGQMVGTYLAGTFSDHGFLDTGGRFTTIDGPVPYQITAANGTQIKGINNVGQIVGTYNDNTTQSFLATPAGHTHLLWNNVDGRVMVWSIAVDGSFTLNGFGTYTDASVGSDPNNRWSATALATGADGLSHLLWNNMDGRVMLWTVDDSGNFSLAGYGPYTDDSTGSYPAFNKWKATAISVGPDNVVHLLWNNTDGRVMLWNVAQDFSFTLAGYGPYTDTSVSSDPGNLWSAAALATGPDNVSRIVWNNVDGRVMLWDVAPDFSFTLAGYGPYTDGAAQNRWSAASVSVGPDNATHLLWGNTDRRAMFWNVNPDFSFTLAAGYGPYTDNGVNNLWSAKALATGLDGLSHILWGNTDHRVMPWSVNNAGDFGSAGNFGVTFYGPYTDDSVSHDPSNLWSATAVSTGP